VTRQFTATPAKRARVPLFIGITGPSGSGKTYSALRLATGIQRTASGQIFVIDTEAGRALHYADDFKFQHVPFAAPFGAFDYLDAIKFCVDNKASSIIIDSASHMHEGPGGMLEQHSMQLDKFCGDKPRNNEQEWEWEKRRDKNNMRAWISPKRELGRFVQALLQLHTNVIFCFRAKEKIKPSGDKPIDMGFCAIADDSLIYEMTCSPLLLPGSRGVPKWDPVEPGSKLQTKLPKQFEAMLRRSGQPLSEEVGEMMGRWAAGESTPVTPSPTVAVGPTEPAQPAAELDALLEQIAAAPDTGAVAAIAAANKSRAWDDEQRSKIRTAIQNRSKALQS
jgi:hypothetical protein